MKQGRMDSRKKRIHCICQLSSLAFCSFSHFLCTGDFRANGTGTSIRGAARPFFSCMHHRTPGQFREQSRQKIERLVGGPFLQPWKAPPRPLGTMFWASSSRLLAVSVPPPPPGFLKRVSSWKLPFPTQQVKIVTDSLYKLIFPSMCCWMELSFA